MTTPDTIQLLQLFLVQVRQCEQPPQPPISITSSSEEDTVQLNHTLTYNKPSTNQIHMLVSFHHKILLNHDSPHNIMPTSLLCRCPHKSFKRPHRFQPLALSASYLPLLPLCKLQQYKQPFPWLHHLNQGWQEGSVMNFSLCHMLCHFFYIFS